MSQLFSAGSPSIGASASIFPMNIQGWFPLGLTGLVSLQSKTRKSLQHHSLKASILQCSDFFIVQLSHPYMTRKTIALTVWTFVSKVMFLLFNMLSRFVIAFLPRSWMSFHFMAAVTIHSDFETQENESATVSTFSPSIYHEVMR